MAKNIAILGTGGHGWLAFSNYIKKTNHNINLFGLTVDYGGSGGIWYRLQEINNFELTRNIFHIAKPVLPWGDFNKIITYFMSQKFGSEVAKCLDFRSDDLNRHLENFEILSNFLCLEKKICDTFIEFFEYVFRYYLKYKDSLEYSTDKKFCFGYPWQDFVFWNLGKVDDLNVFYKQYGILPKHLNLYFTAKEREVLVGCSKKYQYLGEDIIDNATEPILPHSLEIYTVNQEKATASETFLEILQTSDYIIFPTGSITNWLPLISIDEVLKILQEYSLNQKLIWVVNLEKSKNEVDLIDYIDFLKEKNLSPKLIIPAEYEKYQNKEGFHNFMHIKKSDLKFYPELKIKANNHYDQESLEKILNKIIL
jgi:hypothetical protein